MNQIETLKSTIAIFGTEIPFWKIAQHLSTLTGGIILLMTFFRLPIKNNSAISINKLYWSDVIALTMLFVFLRFLIFTEALSFGNLVVTFIASFLIAITLAPLIIKLQSIPKK